MGLQAAHCILAVHRSLVGRHIAAAVEVAVVAAGFAPEAKLDPPMGWSSASLDFGALANLADSSFGLTYWCALAGLVLVRLE